MSDRPAAPDELTVYHLGPDPSTVGGIATVIGLCVEHRIGAARVVACPTWRPDASLASAPLAARALATVRRLQTGAILHVHLSERGSFLREGLLVGAAARRDLTVVTTLHGADFMPFAARHLRLVRAVLRRAHLVSCLDHRVQAAVRRIAPGVRSEVVPNPVLVDEHPTAAAETDELVVFAGEIGLRKGTDVLCQAWPIVVEQRPDARCLIVGPVNDYRPPEIERLQVRAPAGPEEIRQIIRSARVVALPARAEGMPMILAEAMSQARPFVSTPVGAIAELAGGGGGILVPVDDHQALAQRLIELLADPKLAQSIGDRGARHCAKTRSVPLLDARWRALYEEARESTAQKSRRSRPVSDEC